MTANPFSLTSHSSYQRWREEKLAQYPISLDKVVTNISDPTNLSVAEKTALHRKCQSMNFALYHCDKKMEKSDVKALGHQLGLARLATNICADPDGVSSVRVQSTNNAPKYIPYTNKPLNWHTDGYYHLQNESINSFILHCVSTADLGGENRILDHEIAYLLLRDENPDYVKVLMHKEAMTIPSNNNGDTEIRKESTGPVFTITGDGHLHMRYTARTRSIQWLDNALLSEARAYLSHIINDSKYVLQHTLAPNQGLVCNNTLHARDNFTDSDKTQRLIYRARYYDRINTET